MTKILHTGIVVKNMEESVEFYTKVFGLKKTGEHELPGVKLVFLAGENQSLELLQFPGGQEERRGVGVIDHIAFAVDDIEIEISRLKELGIPLNTEEPREAMEGMKIFYFSGPNGEQIELVKNS